MRALLERQFTFDVLDPESDLTQYRLVILPDMVAVSAPLKTKINAYVTEGGRVLLTGSSGIDAEGFLFDVGAAWEGVSPHTQGELPAADRAAALGPRQRSALHVCPVAAHTRHRRDIARRRTSTVRRSISADTSTRPVAPIRPATIRDRRRVASSTSRTRCSVPTRPSTPWPCCRSSAAPSSTRGTEKTISTSLSTTGRATLRRQALPARHVLHLMHVTPALRRTIHGDAAQPIQDLATLRDVAADGRAREGC